MQRADCRNGVLLINKVSADEDEFATLYVVSDRMSEGDCLTVIDKRDINASPLELVNECLVVIGTHSYPASLLHLFLAPFIFFNNNHTRITGTFLVIISK